MRWQRLAAALIIAFAATATQPAEVAAHNWFVDNKCSWTYNAYFDLAGPQSAWSFHSAGGGCHVDGTLVAGAPTAWGVWYLPNSSNYNHTYHAAANIVCATPDHRGNQVNYRMYPWGSVGAYRAYVIDQRAYCSWREITYLGFTATQGGQARVVNGTACGNCAGMRFVVDAFQWYP